MTILPLLAAAAVSHPVLPMDATWVGILVIIIAALFLAALVIGPLVRLNAPEIIPDTHSHTEPPGSRH